MTQRLDHQAFETLFRSARTHNTFLDKPVTDDLLHQLYDLMTWGPTAMNGLPARLVFVKSKEAKEKLKPVLSPGNVDKTIAAPATVIVAYDLRFFDHLPTLFPAYDARLTYEANPGQAQTTAFRNGTLQGGYLILAARALGLDVGPMSGFDNDKLDQAFFPNGAVQIELYCQSGLWGREWSVSARTAFEF